VIFLDLPTIKKEEPKKEEPINWRSQVDEFRTALVEVKPVKLLK
jgi:hypothetical protein